MVKLCGMEFFKTITIFGLAPFLYFRPAQTRHEIMIENHSFFLKKRSLPRPECYSMIWFDPAGGLHYRI